MNILVAVDNNWAIGNKNQLLVSIPSERKMLHEETAGKVVVLGRKTLDVFSQGLPIKSKANYVLSKDSKLSVKGAQVVKSVEVLMEELKNFPSEDIFVVGGASIYEQLLPYCDTVHVTKIDREYQADAYFPNLDKSDEWIVTDESDEFTYFDIAYEFIKYQRKK